MSRHGVSPANASSQRSLSSFSEHLSLFHPSFVDVASLGAFYKRDGSLTQQPLGYMRYQAIWRLLFIDLGNTSVLAVLIITFFFVFSRVVSLSLHARIPYRIRSIRLSHWKKKIVSTPRVLSLGVAISILQYVKENGEDKHNLYPPVFTYLVSLLRYIFSINCGAGK